MKFCDTRIFKILHEVYGRIATWKQHADRNNVFHMKDLSFFHTSVRYFVFDIRLHEPTFFVDAYSLHTHTICDAIQAYDVEELSIFLVVECYEHDQDKYQFGMHQDILLNATDPVFDVLLKEARKMYPEIDDIYDALK